MFSLKAVATMHALLLASTCSIGAVMAQSPRSPADEADAAAVNSYVPPERPSFNEAEHRAYFLSGNHTVDGQAFLRQAGGGIVNCAGNQVLLFPATAYFSDALLDPHFVAGKTPAELPDLAESLVRVAMCDGDGNFYFDALPAGRWIVVTKVQWTVGATPQGGHLASFVDVPLRRKLLLTRTGGPAK